MFVELCHNAVMDKSLVVSKLREHAPELMAAGIVHLRLHGSVARGEETPASDVDLIAEFDASRRFSILDMVRLERELTEMLGIPVDLSLARALKEPVRLRADREAVIAF